MRSAVAAFLLAASLHAQPPLLPVPATGSVTCAWSCGWQIGDQYTSCDVPMCPTSERWRFDPGECWLTAYCDAADIRVGMPPGSVNIPIAVRIGATFYWQTANVRQNLVPYANGECIPLLALSTYTSDAPTAILSEAAPGWDAVFGANHVVVAPSDWVAAQAGGLSFDSFVLSMPVPFDASLIGAYVQCQGVRYDPDGRFYLSAAMLAQIGN